MACIGERRCAVDRARTFKARIWEVIEALGTAVLFGKATRPDAARRQCARSAWRRFGSLVALVGCGFGSRRSVVCRYVYGDFKQCRARGKSLAGGDPGPRSQSRRSG